MSATSQLDLHPGAESLNAFLEQALPEEERQQILSHLGACSRCREVVFLAQDAAGELEAAEASARKNRSRMQLAATRTGYRFGAWQLAWVPAAALAGIVGVAMWVHVRRAGQVSELAKAAPQQALQNSKGTPETLPAAPPVPQVAARTARVAGSAVAEKASEPRTPIAADRLVSGTLSPEPLPSPAVPSGAAAIQTQRVESDNFDAVSETAAEEYAAQSNAARARSDVARFKAEAAPPLHQSAHVASGGLGNVAASGQTLAKLHGTMDQGAAQESPSFPGSSSQLQQASAPGSAFAGSPQPETAGKIYASKKIAAALPSGLPAVSTVTAGHLMLAVDTAGSLFLSDTSTGNWDPVVRQWSGRAISVRIQQDLKPIAGVAARAAAGVAEAKSNGRAAGIAPALAAAPEVFELLNDSDRAWVSPDGKTWKPK